jgi:hypothetical protein
MAWIELDAKNCEEVSFTGPVSFTHRTSPLFIPVCLPLTFTIASPRKRSSETDQYAYYRSMQ